MVKVHELNSCCPQHDAYVPTLFNEQMLDIAFLKSCKLSPLETTESPANTTITTITFTKTPFLFKHNILFSEVMKQAVTMLFVNFQQNHQETKETKEGEMSMERREGVEEEHI